MGELVNLFISSTSTSIHSERRFAKSLTVLELKNKLELLIGDSAATMNLQLFNKDNQFVCKMTDNEALLGSFPVEDMWRIHVFDPSRKTGEFDDVSKVEKYELSEDAYAQRTDSVRAFKQRMKLGEFKDVSPEEREEMEKLQAGKAAQEQARLSQIQPGLRCLVEVTAQPQKRGTIMFVGETKFKPGVWVGIKYDEPVGKNDGSVAGHRYFECQPKYGGFVKALNVTVGDYPEIDDVEMDEI